MPLLERCSQVPEFTASWDERDKRRGGSYSPVELPSTEASFDSVRAGSGKASEEKEVDF